MPTRRLLLLDPAGLTAYRWAGGAIVEDQHFTKNNEGIAAFGHYVLQEHGSIFTVVTDLTDESFQVETVPFVRGADREALLQRRLSQYYFSTPYSVAISLGREASGRRDEKVLFAALTTSPELEPWMAALRQASVQLAALYAMPQAISVLAKQLRLNEGHHLVLSVTARGVRQTFVENGQFRLSRLTPLASATLGEAAMVCAAEAGKLYNYLTGQRLIERGARLNTLVIAAPAEVDAIRGVCSARPELKLDIPPLHDLARRVGIRSLPAKDPVDTVLLHLLASRPPVHQFAPEEERHVYRVGQIGFSLRALGLLVLIACTLLTAKKSYDVYTLRAEMNERRLDTEADQKRYQSAMASLPALPASADKLATLAALNADIQRQSPSLANSLRQVSSALDATPEIELQAIDWRLTDRADASATSSLSTPIQAAGANGARNAPLNFILIDIDAQLPTGMARDNRLILATIDGFVERLRKSTGGEVNATKLPFDTESGKTLRSEDDSGKAPSVAPAFQVRVAQRIN